MYGFTMSTPERCLYLPEFNGTHKHLLAFMRKRGSCVEGMALYRFTNGKPLFIGTIIRGLLIRAI